MKKRVRHRPAGPKGFSLIELLLVLVILATLTAIVAPRFAGRSEEARITAAAADISNIETSLESFEVNCGRYPTEEEGLDALLEQPADLAGWKGPYLKRGLPKDPWGNAYYYARPGIHNKTDYDVYSAGPNGLEGDEDDIGNWEKED